jgi:mannan endo-1,4-beta-mannosidase
MNSGNPVNTALVVFHRCMSIRKKVSTNAVLMLVCFLLLGTALRTQPKYIQVSGTHFILDGKPYYFTGTNFWQGFYLGSPGQTGNRERLLRELDRLKTAGIENLRILAGSELSEIQNSLKPAMQLSPQVYDDSLSEGLDFLLSEIGKRSMHAVVILNNFWEWSGGMAQYHSWFGGGKVKDPSKDGFTAFMNYSSAFYRNAQANEGFNKFVSDLINRKNKFTGLFYYEDPAIMAWELANEPRPGIDAVYINSFYDWIDGTAEYIHSIDTNHLVTTGNEGTMGCLGSEDIFLRAHQSKYIDYATIHVWALNWGWFNPYNSNATYASALAKAKEYIQKHALLARELNKPLTMEEFGLPRDVQSYSPGSATTVRDKYYAALFEIVYDSAAAGSPVAGSNFWGWGGEVRSPNSDYTWRVGDPFVCDPPMEKQGLNSVFDTDSSTIDVIEEHSALMASIGKINGVARENIVSGFELYQNYPNPFNAVTHFRFAVSAAGEDPREAPASHRSGWNAHLAQRFVSLKVFDVLGKEAITLVNREMNPGQYTVQWDASNFPSGIYFYRFQMGGFVEAKKMVLIK